MDQPTTGPASAEDDRRLARRALAGDQEAFTLLVRRHQRHVARIVGGFFRQRETVEDVAQEVFLKAYQALASWRAEVPMARWLARIAVNASYDQLRRQRRGREVPISQIAADVPGLWDRLLAPEDHDAEAFWRREDARLAAERLLARLAPAERLVLTLTALHELPVAEVARLTGWSRVNVKVRALRARRKLRGMLERERQHNGGGSR